MELLDSLIKAISVLGKGRNFVRLLEGLGATIWISTASIILSIAFGFLFGIVMARGNKAIRLLCSAYLAFMRIMPQLVLLFLAYFGLTHAFGISISGEAASILVFSLWGTAEMGDLVRAALQSIPLHQYESGRALGLTEGQIFLYIIIPQTIKRLLPVSLNLITRMIKTSPLIVFVGVIEVVKVGQQIIEANRLSIPTASIAVYGLIFCMYFIICWPFSLAAGIIERKEA